MIHFINGFEFSLARVRDVIDDTLHLSDKFLFSVTDAFNIVFVSVHVSTNEQLPSMLSIIIHMCQNGRASCE